MSITPNLDKCFPNHVSGGDFFFPDGSWLCGDGPFKAAVAKGCALDPGLHKMDVKTRLKKLDESRSRVAVLETDDTGFTKREDLASPADFEQYLHELDARSLKSRGRIYILEGLHPKFVSLLGNRFRLDPSMFKKQERACVFATEHEWSNDNCTLPSSRSKQYLHLRYFEVLNFGKSLPSLRVSCADTGRHIGVNSFSGKLEPNAPVRRKVTFWSAPNKDGGWDAVILCDPPVREILDGDAADGHQQSFVQTSPFQGGYVDFIPFDKRRDGAMPGPPRTCFLEDFIYYFTTYSAEARTFGITCPSIFIKKLIAAHLLEFTSYMRGLVYYQSWLIAGKDPGVSNDNLATSKQHWGAAQGLSLRCSQYIENLKANQAELHSNLDADERRVCASSTWLDHDTDFAYVYECLKEVQRRADTLTNSLGAMASMAAGRQASDDGRRGQMLTVVGMIFIPLAYVTGLFSMSDGYRPGDDLFWVYFAVAIPGVFLVMLATVLLNYLEVFERPVSESAVRLRDKLAQWTPRFEKKQGAASYRGRLGSKSVVATHIQHKMKAEDVRQTV